MTGVVAADIRGGFAVNHFLAGEQGDAAGDLLGVGPRGVEQRHYFVGKIRAIDRADEFLASRVIRRPGDGDLLKALVPRFDGA